MYTIDQELALLSGSQWCLKESNLAMAPSLSTQVYVVHAIPPSTGNSGNMLIAFPDAVGSLCALRWLR